MKLCTSCRQIKDNSEFYKNKSKYDGLDNRCKSCTKIRNKKYREEKCNEECKKYTHSNEHPDFCFELGVSVKRGDKCMKKRASKCFANPKDALVAFRELIKEKDSKKEIMTDDEIMRFNEVIMAKVHKREVQPLGSEEDIRASMRGEITIPELLKKDSGGSDKPVCPECESDKGVIPMSNEMWHCGDCNVDIEADSKPPEPKPTEFNQSFPSLKINDPSKVYEPREDESFYLPDLDHEGWFRLVEKTLKEKGYRIVKNETFPSDKECFEHAYPDYKVVKREDLQWLWYNGDYINEEARKKAHRIKEEYSIEKI